MDVLWYRDLVYGFKIPLARGFGPLDAGCCVMLTSVNDLFTGYGAANLRVEPRRFAEDMARSVSRTLSSLGIASAPEVKSTTEGGFIVYRMNYPLPQGVLSVTVKMGRIEGRPMARIYMTTGIVDPGELEWLSSMITPVEQVRPRTYMIPDVMRGMNAIQVIAPEGFMVAGQVNYFGDLSLRGRGLGAELAADTSRYLAGQGFMFQYLAGQMAQMGYRIGGYIDAYKYSTHYGTWDTVIESRPPPLALPYELYVQGVGMMGAWSGKSSVITLGGGVAGWFATIGYQLPLPGLDAIEWRGVSIIARGGNALDVMLTVMTHLLFDEKWMEALRRENRTIAQSTIRSIRNRPRVNFSSSYTSYNYAADTSYGSDYGGYDDYTSRDTTYDDWDTGRYRGYDDYSTQDIEKGDVDDEERGLGRFRSDADYTQFYVDYEGKLRSYDHDEEVAASFIEDDGYLRDEEGRTIGRIEDGWVVDEETGERIGVLNTRISDDYQLERLEDNMLNPRETLGYTDTAPRDKMRDLNPYYVSKKREDDD
ncbi:MAG: hypothetical protein GSR86_05530 [Desulfurococcales archaeon]|nr:hypothetical protein [Desulfurococcales archaeon]